MFARFFARFAANSCLQLSCEKSHASLWRLMPDNIQIFYKFNGFILFLFKILDYLSIQLNINYSKRSFGTHFEMKFSHKISEQHDSIVKTSNIRTAKASTFIGNFRRRAYVVAYFYYIFVISFAVCFQMAVVFSSSYAC